MAIRRSLSSFKKTIQEQKERIQSFFLDNLHNNVPKRSSFNSSDGSPVLTQGESKAITRSGVKRELDTFWEHALSSAKENPAAYAVAAALYNQMAAVVNRGSLSAADLADIHSVIAVTQSVLKDIPANTTSVTQGLSEITGAIQKRLAGLESETGKLLLSTVETIHSSAAAPTKVESPEEEQPERNLGCD